MDPRRPVAAAGDRRPMEGAMDPIRSVYENDPDMLEIVREFAAELPARANELENTLSSGDLKALKTLAHQLKGAGGGYGFNPITDTAASLEQALKDGASEAIIKERCARLCETLRAVVIGEGS
jgi:HPt (histidine-containing phosphotransfer) domain-containing protein